VAEDVTDHIAVFVLWGDPDMVLPPGEVFDHRGML
jgi:hypothetical protein